MTTVMPPTRQCPRCGLRRKIHESRPEGLCRECRMVEPNWPNIGRQRTARPAPLRYNQAETQKRLTELLELRFRVEQEITALQAKLQQRPPRRNNTAICGTDSGYAHHRRQLKEPACDACKAAHRAYERERLKNTKARAADRRRRKKSRQPEQQEAVA